MEINDVKLTVNLKIMNMREKVTFGERMIYIVDVNENDEIKNHPVTLLLREIVGLTKDVVYRKATAGMGDDLADADARRDKAYSSVKNCLEGFSGFNGERGDAARALLEFFDKPISDLNYSEQTQAMNNVIKNLSTTKSRALIEIVGITNEVDELKESQKSFWELYGEKQNVTSELKKQRSASSYNRELTAAIRDFLSFVWVMRKQPPWSDLYFDMLTELQSEKQAKRG